MNITKHIVNDDYNDTINYSCVTYSGQKLPRYTLGY